MMKYSDMLYNVAVMPLRLYIYIYIYIYIYLYIYISKMIETTFLAR